MKPSEKLSFVIPCYRSANLITRVVADIEATVSARGGYDYEIILVNDSSPDDTYEVLAALAAHNTRIQVVNLARNFGQAAAIMAGYHYVTGDIIINLDDDGQTDPKYLFTLVDTLHNEDLDIVFAKYPVKKHSAFRNFGSRVNDMMAEYLIGKPKDLVFTSYFAAKGFVIDEVLRYDKPYPYVDGLLMQATRRVGAVEIPHKEREEGESGYNLAKLLKLWLNGFTAFSVRPLRIATVIGLLVALTGFIYGIYIIAMELFHPSGVPGWASLMAVTVLLGGMHMVMLGLVGEYIGRIYISQNNAPQYVIRNTINTAKEKCRTKGADETDKN